MTNEMTNINYQDLNEFLAKNSVKGKKNVVPTNTRIPDTKLKIYGGSFHVCDEEFDIFNKLYYEYIFVNKKKEYLTEKQLEHGGAMCVDFDFRYSYEVDRRLHTPEHVEDAIILYLEELKKYLSLIILVNLRFSCFKNLI